MKYRNLCFEERGKRNKPPIAINEIINLQDKLNVELPQQYSDFLHKTNGGGKPDKYVAVTQRFKALHEAGETNIGYSGDYPIDAFLGITSDHYDIEDYFSTYQGRIPNNTMPIAAVDGGGIIILGLKDDIKDKVYAWFHEGESETLNANNFDNVFLIEETFDNFLDSLLNHYQFMSRFYNDAKLIEEKESWDLYLNYYKKEKEIESLAYHYLDGAFLNLYCKNFDLAETCLQQGETMFADLRTQYGNDYQLPTDVTWDKWQEYSNTARQEVTTHPDNWKSRFADRMSTISKGE